MNETIRNQESVTQAGAAAAKEIPVAGRVRSAGTVRRLKRDLETIRQAYKQLVFARQGVTKAYEWLFDNYYILEREGRLLARELLKLDPLPGGPGGEPAVTAHARKLCEAARGSLDAAAIEAYVAGAQQERDFESCELNAFCPMLRAALIEGAARACGGACPRAKPPAWP